MSKGDVFTWSPRDGVARSEASRGPRSSPRLTSPTSGRPCLMGVSSRSRHSPLLPSCLAMAGDPVDLLEGSPAPGLLDLTPRCRAVDASLRRHLVDNVGLYPSSLPLGCGVRRVQQVSAPHPAARPRSQPGASAYSSTRAQGASLRVESTPIPRGVDEAGDAGGGDSCGDIASSPLKVWRANCARASSCTV